MRQKWSDWYPECPELRWYFKWLFVQWHFNFNGKHPLETLSFFNLYTKKLKLCISSAILQGRSIFTDPGSFQDTSLHTYVQVVLPKSLSSRTFRKEHAIHKQDQIHSEYGRKKKSSGPCYQWANGNCRMDKHCICFAGSNMIWVH